MGFQTVASGSHATAMNRNTIASGKNATAMGMFNEAQSYVETVIGAYNLKRAPGQFEPNEWNPTDPLFVIGNGTGDSSRSNALTVWKNGNLFVEGDQTIFGDLLISGVPYRPGGGSWINSSDARLKTINGPYRAGLEAISALEPVRFHYKDDNARGHDSQPEYVGFSAQHVQQFIPEAVSEGDDGYLDLDMHAINVALVNAVKELKAQNKALQAQLVALRDSAHKQQAQIAALGKDNDQLRAMQTRLAAIESWLADTGNRQRRCGKIAVAGQALSPQN
jgi:hypothetical protein